MHLEVYLIKDKDSTVIANFTNERRAVDYVARNPDSEIEKIEVIVPRFYKSNVGQSELRSKSDLIEQSTKTLDEHIAELMKRLVFEENGGNVDRSARVLKIHPNTLRSRMKKLGLL
jgi:DNA-binding PucR family transcriptional regulator